MEGNRRPSQCTRVIQYIERFGSITAGQADAVLGVKRLASRINEIKHKMGIPVAKRWVIGKNRWEEETRYAEYYFPMQEETKI